MGQSLLSRPWLLRRPGFQASQDVTSAKIDSPPSLHLLLRLGRKHGVRFDARFVNLMVAMIVVQAQTENCNLTPALPPSPPF